MGRWWLLGGSAAELGEPIFPFFFFFLSVFIFPGMGSSKLIAIKPRNHLETQTSAYTLVAYGERARVQTFKVTVYLHPKVGPGEAEEGNCSDWGRGRGVAKGSWGAVEAGRGQGQGGGGVPAPHLGSDGGHLDVVWRVPKAACVWNS